MFRIIIIISIVTWGCNEAIDYPEGGYPYPKDVAAKDTNLYFYQIREISTKRDAFDDYYGYLFFKRFDEPNLSIRAGSTVVYRLSCYLDIDTPLIISLSNAVLTIKQGSNETNEFKLDTSRLTYEENRHLKMLDRLYPIDTVGKSPMIKYYIDSMVKKYPRLLDVVYYHELYEKSFVPTGVKYKYKTSTVRLSKKDIDSLINQINASGFWTLPPMTNCKAGLTEYHGFTLEANTKYKYQVATQFVCPGNNNSYTLACEKLLEMAGFRKEQIHLIWPERPGQ